MVFGASGVGSGGVLNLSTLNGVNGFVLNGIDPRDRSGRSVSSAGDVNGDGIDDLIIGATQADPNGINSAGESYVVFGRNLAPAQPCDGDANGDGVIGFADITSVLGNWTESSCPAGKGVCGIDAGQGDANGDGIVTFADITTVLGNWPPNGCP